MESLSHGVISSKEREIRGQKLQIFITEETTSVGPKEFLLTNP